MSDWRDIWKEAIRVNSSVARSGDVSEYDRLYEKYGDDGMIHYTAAASYELLGKQTEAMAEYEKARDCFPAPHWKDVAAKNAERLKKRRSPEQFFEQDDFNELLWYGFQKMYEFVNLDPFNRYIALSALARGSSEWSLSLVDFRTVMELTIKQYYPEIIETTCQKDSLLATLKELQKQTDIPKHIIDTLHAIRKAGNIAAHDARIVEAEKIANAKNFIKAMAYFNNLEPNKYIV